MGSRGQKKAYEFFRLRCDDQAEFSLKDVASYTGWSVNTVQTYPSKQWEGFLERLSRGKYRVLPVFGRYSFEVFLNLNSQKQALNKDPFKPLLPEKVERLVKKSRESALTAVQIFNSPFLEFRTPSFLVHMVIAWSSLLHAVFEEQGVDYWYKNEDGSDFFRDGHRVHWDLSRCIRQYYSGQTNPETENLKAFITLRNEIEHRFAPQFDVDISAECQACLLNFERQLTENFGDYYSIGTRVAIPLQLSQTSSKAKLAAMRELHAADYEVLRERLSVFRASLSEEIYGSQDYAFRVFLVPKPANRASASDMQVEFIRPEEFDAADLKTMQKQVALIKTKQVPVANKDLLKPAHVVHLVKEVEPRFRMHEHTLAWKAFGVRKSREALDSRYCVYDELNNEYLYRPCWAAKLRKFFQDPNALDKLRRMQGG